MLLCSCRLADTTRRPLKVLETILGYLQARQDRVAAAVMALVAAQGFGASRPLVAGLSADAAVVNAESHTALKGVCVVLDEPSYDG